MKTYIWVKDKWAYLYRAVDSTGASIDFLLSAHRDAAAAKRFFQSALRADNGYWDMYKQKMAALGVY